MMQPRRERIEVVEHEAQAVEVGATAAVADALDLDAHGLHDCRQPAVLVLDFLQRVFHGVSLPARKWMRNTLNAAPLRHPTRTAARLIRSVNQILMTLLDSRLTLIKRTALCRHKLDAAYRPTMVQG